MHTPMTTAFKMPGCSKAPHSLFTSAEIMERVSSTCRFTPSGVRYILP